MKHSFFALLALASFLSLVPASRAETNANLPGLEKRNVHVNKDFMTITFTYRLLSVKDTVLLKDGTYSINPNCKAVQLMKLLSSIKKLQGINISGTNEIILTRRDKTPWEKLSPRIAEALDLTFPVQPPS